MSRAFTREDDSENALSGLGERPVSPHRNLVTQGGLAAIDRAISDLREELAKAEQAGNRERIAMISRDLRYWASRRESAELVLADPDSTVVRFGMTVTIENEDGRTGIWTIVGEDEADAARGTISHASPMAQALFGKTVGDLATVNGKEWEIRSISAA